MNTPVGRSARDGIGWLLLAAAAACAWVPAAPADDAGPDRGRVREWVGQLADPRFAVREAAAERLRGLGLGAVDTLEGVIDTADAEQAGRASGVLRQVILSGLEKQPAEAAAVLAKLAVSGNDAVAGWAFDLLDGQMHAKNKKVEPVLQQLAKNADREVAERAKKVLHPLPDDPQLRRYVEARLQIEGQKAALEAQLQQLQARKDADANEVRTLQAQIAQQVQIIDRINQIIAQYQQARGVQW